MKLNIIACTIAIAICTGAEAQQKKSYEMLIKVADSHIAEFTSPQLMKVGDRKVESLGGNWFRVESKKPLNRQLMSAEAGVEYAQPNYPLGLLHDFSIQDPLRKAALAKSLRRNKNLEASNVPPDNPAIPETPTQDSGVDPLIAKQWGMNDIGATKAWEKHTGSKEIIVAVIDTGVDYTHEDLVGNLWRNEKEIPNNNIDDDGNGYIDDVIGWDFASDDNKPYDLIVPPLDMLFKGGNPGHGTHCAGNVAAQGSNGKGIAGVAPNVKIMPIRFISEKGQGTTAAAIKAIYYAVNNGAQITSNSWGGEGDPNDPDAENKALKDAIQYAQEKGSLFIAAAGNGRKGKGYNMDNDPSPVMPASYDHEIIVSVAALDVKDQLGAFSNWGEKLVDIGAPGVNVFSTTVDNKYSDIVVDKMGFKATWDGTSMATPHVAGAAALYWSAHPQATWREVKAALFNSVKPIPALKNKVQTGGKLNLDDLL